MYIYTHGVTETFIRKRHFLRGIRANEVRHHKFWLTYTDANVLKVPGQKMAEINLVLFSHIHIRHLYVCEYIYYSAIVDSTRACCTKRKKITIRQTDDIA